jgi:hypothetical protein
LESHVISRRDLHDLVWREPMTRLAKKYGLSDVGLAKLLTKHDIPRPPRGYWAKLQFGKLPEQTLLPDPDKNPNIPMRDPVEPSEPVRRTELEAELDKWRDASAPIKPALTLRGAHPLVSSSRDALEGAKRDEIGFIERPEDAPLDIEVTKSTLRRALFILDALLKAFEKQGYMVTSGPTVQVLGVPITFAIYETTETKRDPDYSEVDFEGPYHFGHSRFNETRVGSGQLALKITSPDAYWAQGSRKTWRDAKAPLEERLHSFAQGVVKFASVLKEHAERRKEEERQRALEAERCAEQARLRAENLKLIKAERKRVRELYKTAVNWKRSQALREYIAAAKQNGISKNGCQLDGVSFDQWIAWASAQADRLDPFRESPPSVLDEDTAELAEEGPRRLHSW